MNARLTILAVALLGMSYMATGCIGTIRETNTPRTSTEMLLVSSAAERSVKQFDASPMKGKRVFLDDSKFDSIDKNYLVSALRNHLAGAGATLTATADPVSEAKPAGSDIVIEIRNASLGIYTADFTLGLPSLPFSVQGSPPLFTPPLYAFRRYTHQGFCKIQLWYYDPATMNHLGDSGDLWGKSYYNQWYWFGVGPFDGSNDIYPDVGIMESVTGTKAFNMDEEEAEDEDDGEDHDGDEGHDDDGHGHGDDGDGDEGDGE